MAPNEIENINDIHGYLKANMIVLHSSSFDHKSGDRYIYVPTLFVINPEQICAFEEIKNSELKTKLYFSNRESENVYEDINEILDLLEQCNIGQIKCATQKLND